MAAIVAVVDGRHELLSVRSRRPRPRAPGPISCPHALGAALRGEADGLRHSRRPKGRHRPSAARLPAVPRVPTTWNVLAHAGYAGGGYCRLDPLGFRRCDRRQWHRAANQLGQACPSPPPWRTAPKTTFSPSNCRLAKLTAGPGALVLLTEWDLLRALDLERVKQTMHAPMAADLRNIYRPNEMARRGFRYTGVGRAKRWTPDLRNLLWAAPGLDSRPAAL